MAKKNKNQIQ